MSVDEHLKKAKLEEQATKKDVSRIMNAGMAGGIAANLALITALIRYDDSDGFTIWAGSPMFFFIIGLYSSLKFAEEWHLSVSYYVSDLQTNKDVYEEIIETISDTTKKYDIERIIKENPERKNELRYKSVDEYLDDVKKRFVEYSDSSTSLSSLLNLMESDSLVFNDQFRKYFKGRYLDGHETEYREKSGHENFIRLNRFYRLKSFMFYFSILYGLVVLFSYSNWRSVFDALKLPTC